MKEMRTPQENLEMMFRYMARSYAALAVKTVGKAQFHLSHEGQTLDCYLAADQEGLTFAAGVTAEPTVTLTASLTNWLKLAGGELNPVLGVMTGRLKFRGDTAFFSRLGGHLRRVAVAKDPVTPFEKSPQRHWVKPDRVLVVNGSPRGDSGYTRFYLEPFVTGMTEAGASIELVNLKGRNIQPCRGCWHCWTSGTGRCVIKDDMTELAAQKAAADLVVYAFPLYVDGVPVILKNFVDRSVPENYPYMTAGRYKTRHPRRQPKNQSLALFAICGFPEITHFDAVRAHFRAWSHNSHQPLVAEVFRPACMYLYNNPLVYHRLLAVLAALREGGAQLVERGGIAPKTRRLISQPAGKVDDFHKESNMFWDDLINSPGAADY